MAKLNKQIRFLYRPRNLWTALLLSLIAILFGFENFPQNNLPAKNLLVQTQSPTPSLIKRVGYYPVTKVIDGDTIDVLISGKKETVRFIGIDTPEVHDPRKPVQCYGKEAWDKAKSLLQGQQVRLESDSTQGDRDKYNRLLRYIFLEDGTHVNSVLIAQGYAHEYTYRIPYAYQVEFITAQRQAREQKLGLWADGVCVSPSPAK